MATKIRIKTTFEATQTIEPIYTGGEVSSDAGGTWLATCANEDILIVDIETSQPVVRIEGDGEPVTSLCLSPTGSHLVICSRSLSMRIFHILYTAESGPATATLERTLKPHSSPVICTAIDETGTLLATGGADSVVKVWDIRGGFTTHTFHGHSGVVSALCFFRHNAVVQKPTAKRKDAGTVDKLTNGNQWPHTICLVSAGEDGKARIWDLNSKKSIATLDSHQSVVRSLAYSPTRSFLLSASRDKTIIIWDTTTWELLRAIPTSEVLETAGFMLDGKYVYAGGENGVLRVWATDSGLEITTKQKAATEGDAIISIVSTARLISLHQDHMIRLYSLQALKELDPGSTLESVPVVRRISGNHDEIIDVACIGPNRSTLALATNTESIRLISGTQRTPNKRKRGSDDEVPRSTFGSDVGLLEGHTDIVICLDVDWSGCWLVTGAKDNTARLWRLDVANSSYSCCAVLAGHAESLGAVALPRTPPQSTSAANTDPLSHPPTFVLTGSQDRTVKRWDTSKLSPSPKSLPQTNAKAIYTRVAHEKDINAIDVAPSAPLFASASQDKTIKVWSLGDGSVAGILRGHKRGVWSIRFSPSSAPPLNLSDGGTSSSHGLLISGSGDRTVKVWSLSTYTCLLTFEGHSNSVLKVLWLWPQSAVDDGDAGEPRQQKPKQPIIASASSDTLIKLWDPYAPPTSDHLLTTLDNHTDRVWALTTPVDPNNPHPPPSNSSTKVQQHQPSPTSLISAAADARLTFWTDTTKQTLTAHRLAASERIEQDQLLSNHIQSKNYRETITLALTLNHPGRLLKVFQDIISLPLPERDPGSITGKHAVDDVLRNLSRQHLYLLLQRVRDWNTNARTSPVAQRILNVVLKAYPPRVFVEMSKDRRLQGPRAAAAVGSSDGGAPAKGDGAQQQGIQDLLRALEVYTERHYRRMEELVDESWILEYTLREMDEVSGAVGVGGMEIDGKNANEVPEADVVME